MVHPKKYMTLFDFTLLLLFLTLINISDKINCILKLPPKWVNFLIFLKFGLFDYKLGLFNHKFGILFSMKSSICTIIVFHYILIISTALYASY